MIRKVNTIKCTECKREISEKNFYLIKGKRIDLCKDCIGEGANYKTNAIKLLKRWDLPFLIYVWNKAGEKNPNKKFGGYLRQINSLPCYSKLEFKDSIFEEKKKDIEIEKYLEEMKDIAKRSESGNIDECHVQADNLLCELLEELGYGELVEIYQDVEKWYS